MTTGKFCPVCGELNDCAIESHDSKIKSNDQNNQTCWCFKKAGTLNCQKLTGLSSADGNRCLCQKCWEKFSKQN